MKLELVIPKVEADRQQLAHVHGMTRELALALEVVALGLFAVALALLVSRRSKGE